MTTKNHNKSDSKILNNDEYYSDVINSLTKNEISKERNDSKIMIEEDAHSDNMSNYSESDLDDSEDSKSDSEDGDIDEVNVREFNYDKEFEELNELEVEDSDDEFEEYDCTLDFDNIDINDFEKYNNLMDSMYGNEILSGVNIKDRKRVMFCDNCQDDDVVEDTSHGIVVCKKCGQIISTLLDSNPEWTQYNDDNKKDMNRCSHPISQLLPQSSTATTIAGSCSSRIKTLHGWAAMPYKERSLNDVFKIIQAKCHEGKIMKCIEDDAKIMYKNISDCKHVSGKNKGKSIIIRGKNRKSVIAGCILFACRKKNKTRSPKEIAELFGLKYTEITKGCKIFQKLAKLKKMEFKVQFTKPEHFITRFCEELKIKENYAEQSIQISNNVQKLQIASVHTPLSLATGSIYLMIHLNGLNIQKKTIAEKFNVSQVTIAKAFKKLEPFIGILTNDKICDKLSVEIKKYQDDIHIGEELKSKFIRFGIDIEKTMGKKHDKIYGIVDEIDGKININERLIVQHNIEFNNIDKQMDNEFTRLNLELADIKYSIIKSKLNIK
jgi:transcription initiation factor TFIIIB Brf1 subunit/transcription initiation factor TFIIB